MHCYTVCRVIATFFLAVLAGQVFGMTVFPKPLSQPSNDASVKLSALQFKLTNRMIEHKTIMAANFEAVSSILVNISSSFDESTLVLSEFKHQLPDLQVEQMPAFLGEMLTYLKVNGGDMKQDVTAGLDNITETLAFMITENDEMDLFLSQALEEMAIIEKEILMGNTKQNDAPPSKEPKPESYKYPGSLASNNEVEEQENLRAIFKHLVDMQHVLPDAYAYISTQMAPPNTTSHFEYFATFHPTLLYQNLPRDYSCGGTLEATFSKLPTREEEAGIVTDQDIEVNCASSAPGEATDEVGAMKLGRTHTLVWFEPS